MMHMDGRPAGTTGKDRTGFAPRVRLPRRHTPGALVVAATLIIGLAACGGGPGNGAAPESPSPEAAPGDAAVVQPGAPGSATRPLDAEDLAATPEQPHTEADVRFMQNMIHHHAQAIQMSRMVPERTDNPRIVLLATRIDRSQGDEIRLMRRWLEVRGEEAPALHVGDEGAGRAAMDPGAMDHGAPSSDEPMMAGMLTPDQLARLEAARDETFDRLFLEAMIYHHEGALDMVGELFAAPGAGQGAEINQFASHVDSDQRIEIGRMYDMLADIDAR